MLARFGIWLQKTVTLKFVVVVLAFCLFTGAAFAFGAAMGRRSLPVGANPPPAPLQNQAPPVGMDGPPGPFGPPRRGTFGAIDGIEGDVIRMRDPRSGQIFRVRAGNNTVIEFGRSRRIPLGNLQVGQRIFVVGAPSAVDPGDEFDAQFIGVVLGQPQRYVRPAIDPMLCWDCQD